MAKKSIQGLTLVLSATLLASCGGGGSGNTSAMSNTPPTTNWQPGIYENAAAFKGYCAAPRSGIDINGRAYTDKAGDSAHEKLWLRSWSHETYLWYNELVDNDITEYSTPQTYFPTLKSTATTPSGRLRDRFHFSQSTEEHQQLVSSGGVSASYGVKLKLIRSTPPRDIRVMYTEPGSPARNAGLLRGTEILSVNGVSVLNGDPTSLNNGLFPENNGETHTFTVRDVGQIASRTITMTAGAITLSPVHNTRVIDTPTGKVGYLTFNTFATHLAENALVSAIETLDSQNISDLVIDLRYNGGGYLPISAELGYMVAGSGQSMGKTFDKLVFNDKHPNSNPVTGAAITPMPFLSTARGYSVTNGQPLPSLNLNKVYVLATGATCSASEALINGLSGIEVEVVLIGSTTCGKPYGFYQTDNCGTTYSTIQFRGENDKGFGDYADGFSPANTTETAGELLTGCYVEDDLMNPLGDENEAMLSAALEHRVSGNCPPVPTGRPLESGDPAQDLNNDPRVIERALKERIALDSLRVVQ